MAKYRALQTNFWDDGFIMDLTPEEKYFYIYLITNSRTTQCGCYELPYRFAEMQTGYNRETVEKLINRFIEYKKIKYNPNTKEILILNWSKHNFTGSPKVMNCILKEIEDIKCIDFKNELYKICIGYGYPIETLCIDLGEKEKEKEKEKVSSCFKYIQHLGILLTPLHNQELISFIEDGIEHDLIIRAVDIAIGNGKRSYAYIKGILNNWIDLDIKNLKQLEIYENEFKNKKSKEKEKEDGFDYMQYLEGKND